mmetsp:Transcript_35531/g.78825  ORF Transcript_35531/g.78825 Transcript_35531/m.78825 type:complete len:487 (-) Transcript_35531:822-2282(-)|eukprot:CAMPEP_0202892426 /NCGR_PEP_ID=MMETSP1392-20130828/2146_1 /ASSEMBLY_ACC=CAM_ASM_000868 /TAXON_ID=225041 /ORGANISM="Chlamydomonas chlamydogama, Strain SAG 11-48b" /LENGTH=486 /DNA_ID=CAMNT_0049576367 /DNA_START=78 /DNA_END=1538 /DNA_ORIENTATION=-
MAEEEIQLFAKPPKKRQRLSSASKTSTEPEYVVNRRKQQEHAADDSQPALVDRNDTAETRQSGEPSTSSSIVTTFKSLGVSEWLCGVCKSLGIVRPTTVQQGCIPAILAGKDVIGLAQTGSGKTAAFALPILQSLAKDPYGIYALVLTPTRELAIQIAEQFRAFGAGMSLKDAVVIGGVDMQQQSRELARRPHVVIATPGRLKGLLDADCALAAGFSRAKYLVLDEADRLLDPTFESDLRTVLATLPEDNRQTLLFSATMTKSLIKLQKAALKDAFVFQAYDGLKTADKLKEQYVFIPSKVKEVYLFHLLNNLAEHKVRSAIIFTSTCKGCELLSVLLGELGLSCAALHSGKPQKQRLAALNQFKSEMVPLLLATDVASRGLDIPSVDLVVNYDLPILARDYVHRVGRTARAGRAGWSVSFVTQYDVQLVHKIEELIGHQLDEFKPEEAEVLKGITKVYSAKRAAMLKVAETEGKDTSSRRASKRG